FQSQFYRSSQHQRSKGARRRRSSGWARPRQGARSAALRSVRQGSPRRRGILDQPWHKRGAVGDRRRQIPHPRRSTPASISAGAPRNPEQDRRTSDGLTRACRARARFLSSPSPRGASSVQADTETLWAVVIGAVLATAGGFAASQLEAYLRRRERERNAAL